MHTGIQLVVTRNIATSPPPYSTKEEKRNEY
jgi:hypothetical protein